MARVLVALFCVVWLMPDVAQAASPDGRFAAKGAGRTQCKRFVEERENHSEAYTAYLGWLTGYLTGYNQLKEDTFDIIPWQSTQLLALLLERYCRENPEEAFLRAVMRMNLTFEPFRMRDESKPVKIERDGKTVVVYAEVLRRAQERLNKLGQLADAPDGAYGPNTAAALIAFQTANNIPVTGLPDVQTLYNLLLAPQAEQQ